MQTNTHDPHARRTWNPGKKPVARNNPLACVAHMQSGDVQGKGDEVTHRGNQLIS